MRFAHSLTVYENTILGIEITHHQDIPNLVDLAMPVTDPRVC
jgi:hypothetical protein